MTFDDGRLNTAAVAAGFHFPKMARSPSWIFQFISFALTEKFGNDR